MKVLGIDFTSSPTHKKPITCATCVFEDGVLRAAACHVSELRSFSEFEGVLGGKGPWIAAMDFPFGQSRKFIETIGWPETWNGYVRYARGLSRPGFRNA